MSRSVPALLLAAAACGNPDNLVIGGVGASDTTPLVIFDNIGSAISGLVMLSDQNGNPTVQSAVVIISDKSGLCDALKANPSYFRQPPEEYEAMIFFMPPGFLGTFVIGRGGDQDNETSSEIIASTGAGAAPAFFPVLSGGYIALTTWADNAGGNASGSFDLLYGNATLGGQYEFSGRFKTDVCTTLDGTLLP